MHMVLVFRKKIFGYGFECEERKFAYELDRTRVRLDRYLLENHIPKRFFAEKYESFGKVLKGFIGFFEEAPSDFPEKLEEAEIETGKYLKFGNSFTVNRVDKSNTSFCVDKRIHAYLEENNIRTDWMRFSSGRNSYLRIIN
ncbi:hypothetical protein CH365_04065 [Leptospira neocaledonica]|uniref:Uncharacterized protein n=1 Tax=Leptospira neocaledonica TaxID=2023192 RepID=A0A2N0A2Y0_9LEPT|nr:hypothetical protein CH365_04065 [Leptospira neocaledonica]